MVNAIPMRSYQYIFNMKVVLHTVFYNIHENKQKKYLIQTRSQAKTSGTVLPKAHDIDKGVDPNIKPEKQIIKPLVAPKLHIPTES